MLSRILDSPWLYFGLAAVLLVAAIASQVEVRLPSRPVGTPEDIANLKDRDDTNVVFILIDTLRADRLSAYGYERETSPYLDLLAGSGVRFARPMAHSSWTKTSMASLWTGMFPRTHGVLRWPHAIPEEATMPAEILRDAGFTTAGIWRNGWVAPNFGFGQGFQTYLRPQPSRRPQDFQKATPSTSPLQGTDADITDSAVEFFKQNRDNRFFLYMHYMDVHQYAYDEASAKFGTSYSDVYDNSISWVDRNVAAVVSELEELGLMSRTIIVIASDHGEGFREHGAEGHGKTLYAEVIDVPLLISLPFRLEPGVVVEPRVQNIDVWPTVLDLVGVDPLPGAQGRSLVPLMVAAAKGETLPDDRPAFAQIDRYWGSDQRGAEPWIQVTEGSHRMIRLLEEEAADGRAELFDHSSDPTEQTNVVFRQPDKAEHLEGRLQEYLSEDRAAWGDPGEVPIEEMRLEQLRALGYVIE